MNQYRRTPRAEFLDYDNGLYFITVCTLDLYHFFGEIKDGKMILNDIGRFAEKQLENASTFRNDVDVIQWVVMPNHIHAIVAVVSDLSDSQVKTGMLQRSPNDALRGNPRLARHVTTLSSYINSFKGAVSKYARKKGIDFNWQSRYHDHMIRGVRDGHFISQYIRTNPARWSKDDYNT